MDEPPSLFFSGFSLLMIVPAAVLLVLVIVSAFLAASETAFFSISSVDLARFRQSISRKEQMIGNLMTNPVGVRLSMLMLNLLTKISFISVSTAWVWDASLSLKVVVAAVFLQSLVLLFAGEVLPRVYARKHKLSFAKSIAYPWNKVTGLAHALTNIYIFLRRNWYSAFQGSQSTLQELTQALERVGNESESGTEREILQGVVNFGSLVVKDVMHPVGAITAINIESDFVELISAINRSGHSRIPVYRKTIDSIEGVLYIKDLLPFLDEGPDFQWSKILRTGFFVPETKKIDLLLKDFQEKRVHLAIVRSTQGETSGLITLEDLIAEIITEINDQPDEVHDTGFKKVSETSFVFDGRTPLEDFFRILEQDHPFFREPAEKESLEDFIIEFNDDLPKVGDELHFEHFTFVIEEIEQKRIKRVRVNVHQQA